MMPRLLPADRGHIVVAHRLFLRPRKEVRGLIDATPLQRNGAADVERAHFERSVPQQPRAQLRDHGPLLAHIQPAEPAVRDAAEQRQHGGLLELVLRALTQVRQERGVVAGIGQLLRHMERRQRPAQLGRERLIPILTGQSADFAFGSKPGEQRLRRARSRLGVSVPPRPAQHHDKIPGRLGEELGAPEEFRSFDHLAQRPLGGRHLALGQEQRRPDSQILGLCRGVRQTTADRPHLIQVATRRLQLATAQADLCPPPERERQQRAIPDRFRLAGGLVGLCQRAVERPLLPIGDPQVVVALGDALPYPSPVEGAEGDLPGPDRLGVPPPQVTDDPQVVAAASRRGKIAVPARDHEGLREVVRRLVDPSADHGDRAPRIEGVTLDRPLVPPARFVQRQIEPPQPFIVAPQARLRGPVQQREGRRIRELALLLRAEVLDDLGVVSGRGELPRPVDYE